ncbi:TrkH family potassium uptake protein [Gulosibacter molinativorax]|uniref:Potassium transporter Trk n=1 Tax=Gulosibacter molinativorax TaxID=256821 RepID=A0ABT7CAS2_9MICO|nr:potassium transporter TrkG [Gulosibacter molinativorax]MDJ1372296.1 potassium transporter Trk [Gulosibacter molinativorax]QUY63390.1 Potassium uptake protein [Gulosibacter molinativorax]
MPYRYRLEPQRRTPWERIRDGLAHFSTNSPSRFAVLIFTSIIALWTFLFMLPAASATGEITPFADALFTAVSTICVTGLAVVDMATHWSTFGNLLVFIGIQAGALGVLTLASLLGRVVTRRLGLRQKLIAASDGNPLRTHAGPVSESQAVKLDEVGGILATAAISLVTIQTISALFILPVFLATPGYDTWSAIYDAYYYAASAFTNTGFSHHPDGIMPFEHNIWFLGCLAGTVFLGSIGFPVIFAIVRRIRTKQRLSVHVKLTLVTTVLLFFIGWIVIYLLEFDNPRTLAMDDPWFRPITAGFMSAMTRSGGFSTVDISEMNDATLLVMDMLMFVGGGSASTAGGIKVTTLAILFLAAVAEAKGSPDIHSFGRRIPVDVLRLAISVALWGATIVAVSSILVMQLSGAEFKYALFDSISAFATCGLSTGLTQELPESATYVLTTTMWLGRVGTVTFAASLASRHKRQLYTLPEERIIVG